MGGPPDPVISYMFFPNDFKLLSALEKLFLNKLYIKRYAGKFSSIMTTLMYVFIRNEHAAH